MSGSVIDDLSALRAAIDERIARVRDGSLSLHDALTSGTGESVEDVGSRFVYVVKILEVVPGVGKVRARRVLDGVGLGERDRVGDLSVETRTQILRELA